jgi:hypothetical protein
MPGRRSKRRSNWSARVSATCATVALALLVPACAGSGFHYVKSSEDRTYFKVPEGWKLYDNDALLEDAKSQLSDDELEQVRSSRWLTVFDAHPHPTIGHVAARAPGFPVGQALVARLSAETADGLSLKSLRNVFYAVDTKITNDKGQMLSYEPVERDGGFHGSHLVAKLTTEKGEMVVNQIALFDQATTKVYALAVACSVECYDRNKSKIEQVVDSWTVKES